MQHSRIRVASSTEGALRAGVCRMELRAALGMAMMGYGARRGTAAGWHDPLYVRALFLAGGNPEYGAVLLVEIDVCLIAVAQARELRERIRSRTGLASRQVVIACTHTHSGPETGLLSVLGGRSTPDDVAPLFDRVVDAAVAAFESAQPARLGTGLAPVAIGRNRRVEGGPVDPDARVVRIDRPDGSPLAVLYLHGCHPTVLGHDNLSFSADWPGAASTAIEEALPGALAIFGLGAHGDVDPRTRGLLDLAIPDQSLGASADEMRALGREVGLAVAEAARGIETRASVEIASASVRIPLPIHAGSHGEIQHDASLERRRREALAALGLPSDREPTIAEWYRLVDERTAGLSPDEVRRGASRVRLLLRDATARRMAGGLVPEVEVQVVRIGPSWLLALPFEVTVDVGRAWRRAVGEGGVVLSIANGWLRYLPHADHFAAEAAGERYEILQSTFEPDAATRLVEAAAALYERLLMTASARGGPVGRPLGARA